MTSIYIDLPLKYAKIVAVEMKKDAAKLIEQNKFRELSEMLFELETLTDRIDTAEAMERGDQ